MVTTPLLSIALFASFAMAYHHLAPVFDNERKRAYILSTISSCTMSIMAIPFVWTYLAYGLEEAYVAGQQGWMGRVGRFGVVFFGTYLFADLAIGYIKYPSQVGLLTGWIHHVVYIGLMFYCTYSHQTPVFLIGAIMELPTFDLSISNLFPQIRNDLRFLSSFFLIRVLFHALFLADCVRPSSRAITQNSWIPVGTLALAFILHASWFHGGLKGYLGRRAKVQAVDKSNAAGPLVNDQMEILAEIDPLVYETLEGSEPGTPEDSPLVTPHTPKTYPILSSLPTLPNLPTMPQIPSIPSLSDLTAALPAREQLDFDFGFKHAVKRRWEVQKDRFAGMQGGGMIDFDRVGLGRRGEGRVELVEDDARG